MRGSEFHAYLTLWSRLPTPGALEPLGPSDITRYQSSRHSCRSDHRADRDFAEYAYYRWRKEYGGLRVDQAKRLKELEKENARLKKLVAEQALDNAILKEVSSGKF